MPPSTGLANIQHRSFGNILNAKPIVERLQPYLILNDGNRMPLLGLGTWNAQGKELSEAVKTAIRAGYRHIDTASNYRNEQLVGEAVRECIDEGLVRREDLFVTTKVWNNSHSASAVPRALRKSLDALNLSYVDLYLIHYPIGYQEGDTLSPLDASGQVITSDVDYVETWRGMEECKRQGLAKSIGVSNFNAEQLARVLCNCSIIPSMNQVECHPYLGQAKLLHFCRSHGIELTAYSPLGSPGRIDKTQAEGAAEPYLIEDPIVKLIARKHQRPAAHVLIRYQIQRGIVAIPKAIQAAHVKSNLDALSFDLDFDDMRNLGSLDRNHRFMKFERCLAHKYYPFAAEY